MSVRVSLAMCCIVLAASFEGCSSDPGVPGLPRISIAGGGSVSSGGAPAAGSSASGTAGAEMPGNNAGSAGLAAVAGGGASSGGVGGSAAGGLSGTSGASESGGAAGGVSHPSGPSPGCGKDFADPFKTAVQHDLTVAVADQYKPAYVHRKYYTQLPTSYDGHQPLPVVFVGAGCGQTGPENGNFYPPDNYVIVQMVPAAVTVDTVVPKYGSPGCFQAGKQGLADSPDGPYFDQALAEVEASYCIDQGRVYAAGYSSGAWLSSFLACARGNVVRAVSTVAGGLQHDHGNCTGGSAVLMIVGQGDMENGVVDLVNGFDVGTGQARDAFIKANGCSAASAAWDAAYPGCQIHGGCDSPVVWCEVPGGHGAGLDMQKAAAWKFWASLK